MKNHPGVFLRGYFLLLFSIPPFLMEAWAQEPLRHSDMEANFEYAKQLLESFHNDSALLILNRLVEQLAIEDKSGSPLGLRARFRQAEALEKEEQNETAIQNLLSLLDDCREKGEWAVLGETQLSLARLYEKIGKWDDCLRYLRLVQSNLSQHPTDSIYPRLCIRLSSYHRLHGIEDSALHYAAEAVRTAPSYDLEVEHATGHMLLGMLLDDHDYQQAVTHYQQAGEYWKKVKDFSGHGATLLNLSKLHLRNHKPRRALLLSDSLLTVAKSAMAVGNETPWLFFRGYQNRGEIFEAMGKLDSAWLYTNKGYQMELSEAYTRNHEKLVEIEGKYQDEKKAEKIKEQQLLLQHGRQKRAQLLGILGLIGLLAGSLVYYNRRLGVAMRKTEKQALIIKETNGELSESLRQQKMLQGEIHHRVKNNLQVIVSLLELQGEELEDMEARRSLEAMSGRIYSMAAIHEILYQKDGAALADFQLYTETLCQHFGHLAGLPTPPEFDLDIREQNFNLETLMPLGIILNELLTNSLKYATIPQKTLRISIQMTPQGEGYSLHYKDNGPGFPGGRLLEREGGLGSYLLESMCRQLNGNIEYRNENGALTHIFFLQKNQ